MFNDFVGTELEAGAAAAMPLNIPGRLLVLCQICIWISLGAAQSANQTLAYDTSAVASGQGADSSRRTAPLPESTETRQAKSPWLAVGLSAALPGLGQVYDKSYWKVPVIWGLGGYWVYEWIHLNDNYKDFRDQYSRSVTSALPNGNNRLLLLRDFYRDERDKFAWYLGALYLLNLIDAYVGASLYDFDVSPDLTANGRIVPRVRASLHLTF